MGIARVGDRVNTVHPALGKNCSQSPTITGVATGSSSVFVNNRPAALVGSLTEPHLQPGCSLHQTPLVNTPSNNVFINNLPAGVEGSTFTCGAQIISSSNNVFVGNR